jgi:hypothetical protein
VTTTLEVAVVGVAELVTFVVFVVVVVVVILTKSNLAVDEELVAQLRIALDRFLPVSTDVLATDDC